MIGEDVIVLDFETTGLSTRSERATEVAAIRVVNGQIVSRYHSLINPGIALSPFIVQLTGITNEMLAGAPRPEAVFPELHRFVGATPVFAHNATFDEGFYRAELNRLMLAPTASFLCTKLIARRVLPGLRSYRLGELAARLDVRFRSAAHRAHADAEVLAHVLNALCRRIQEFGIERVEVPLLRRLMRLTPLASATKYLQDLARSQGQEVDRSTCTATGRE